MQLKHLCLYGCCCFSLPWYLQDHSYSFWTSWCEHIFTFLSFFDVEGTKLCNVSEKTKMQPILCPHEGVKAPNSISAPKKHPLLHSGKIEINKRLLLSKLLWKDNKKYYRSDKCRGGLFLFFFVHFAAIASFLNTIWVYYFENPPGNYVRIVAKSMWRSVALQAKQSTSLVAI